MLTEAEATLIDAAKHIQNITGVMPMRFHQSAGRPISERLHELKQDVYWYQRDTESAYREACRVIRAVEI